MNQPNGSNWRFPAAFGCPRNDGPARFGPNYGPRQRHNGPHLYPRYGPPRWANTYPMWRSQNKGVQPTSPGSTQHSPTSSAADPRRPKGPRTPPEPHPDDQPSLECHLSPSKERPYGSTTDYNDYHSNDKNCQQKHRNQYKAPQRPFYKNPQRNMRGRRNSHPLPIPHPQMAPFQNTCNNMAYDSPNSPLSDSERKPPSALNTAVQSYLLQVLTAQPPPNILPTLCHHLPSTSSSFQTILPDLTKTPPPLPPTPNRPATPPPPPSDEENWDTPSEASNDATAFKLKSPNQDNVSNMEGNGANTLALGLTCDVSNRDENSTATLAAIPTIIPPSDGNADKGHDLSADQIDDYTSFKITLPSRVDRLAHDKDRVEGNVMKEQMTENHATALQSALTIDIPTRDVITSPIANQKASSPDKLEPILKIVTPNTTNSNGEDNNADTIDMPFRINLPHREASQSQERDSVTGNADQTLVKTKSKRKKNSAKSTSKIWELELAEKALCVEQELLKEVNKNNVLILRFPDPTLSSEMVKGFCEYIESVYFQQNSAPRYCFVHLKEGVDVDKSIETISKIPFGTGYIKAELRNVSMSKQCSARADNIDPFTLYVGNLSPTVPCKVLKEHFPGANRINVGFAQRMKHTRYAFIQYQKVDDAIAAYRRMLKSEIEGRSLIIRFKRLGTAATDEDSQIHGTHINDDEEHVETCSTLSASTMPSDMTEDTAITTAESDRNECVASLESNSELNRSEDHCDEPNVQELKLQCEISQPTNMQSILVTAADNNVELNDTSNDVANVNKNNENSCRANDFENSNEGKVLNSDDFNVSKQPVEEPKECMTTYTSTTHIESDPTAMEEFENATTIESTKYSNSNTEQSLTSERQQDTVKSEEILCGIDASERIVYSMPRSSRRLQNLNSGVDIKNKRELNEEFEFFSVRRTSVSASEGDAERPSSTNSFCSSIEFVNACFIDQHLQTIEMSKAVQPFTNETEPKEDYSQELHENINRDTNLLSQALKKNMNYDTLLIDDKISMKYPSGQRYCQSQRNNSNITRNDEDLIPANALLLRRDSRLVSSDTTSTQSYNMNTQLQVKNECLEWEAQKNGIQNSKKNLEESKFTPQISKDAEQTPSKRNNGSRKRKSPSSVEDCADIKPIVPNDDGDDDLIPANCALNLFHKSVTFFDLTLDDDPVMQIKREAETKDLFSLPKRTDKGRRARAESDSINDITYNRNISRGLRNLENSKQHSNGLRSVNAEEKPYCADDDDVVIISDDISPLPHQNLLMSQCLSYPNQKETLLVKNECNSPTSIEKSFFGKHKRPSQHRDNLDRLFALLNSNSDEDS